jgi:hypothetical protein
MLPAPSRPELIAPVAAPSTEPVCEPALGLEPVETPDESGALEETDAPLGLEPGAVAVEPSVPSPLGEPLGLLTLDPPG